jgi:hypothetical protein
MKEESTPSTMQQNSVYLPAGITPIVADAERDKILTASARILVCSVEQFLMYEGRVALLSNCIAHQLSS